MREVRKERQAAPVLRHQDSKPLDELSSMVLETPALNLRLNVGSGLCPDRAVVTQIRTRRFSPYGCG